MSTCDGGHSSVLESSSHVIRLDPDYYTIEVMQMISLEPRIRCLDFQSHVALLWVEFLVHFFSLAYLLYRTFLQHTSR